jgi:hypothetical protein
LIFLSAHQLNSLSAFMHSDAAENGISNFMFRYSSRRRRDNGSA